MGSLSVARNALADALRDAVEVEVWDHVPAAAVAPCVVIVPGDPWLVAPTAPTFDQAEVTVRLLVHALTEIATSDVAADQLDQLVELVTVAATRAGWQLETVRAPALVELAGVAYPTATLEITSPVSLQQEV